MEIIFGKEAKKLREEIEKLKEENTILKNGVPKLTKEEQDEINQSIEKAKEINKHFEQLMNYSVEDVIKCQKK